MKMQFWINSGLDDIFLESLRYVILKILFSVWMECIITSTFFPCRCKSSSTISFIGITLHLLLLVMKPSELSTLINFLLRSIWDHRNEQISPSRIPVANVHNTRSRKSRSSIEWYTFLAHPPKRKQDEPRPFSHELLAGKDLKWCNPIFLQPQKH